MDRHTHSRLTAGFLAVLLLAFTTTVYLPAVGGGFTFDDYPNIVRSSASQPADWMELSASTQHPTRSDRPVARFTFGLNYLASGLDARAYHLTNIAIHAAATVVLFALLLGLTRAPRSPANLARNALAFAFLATLLWGIHPANTQAVSYIVQRMASLAGAFYLLTLLIFVYWRLGSCRARTAIPLLLIFWGLAMGSKMSAATAPVACWLLEVAFFTGPTRRNLRIALAGAVVCLPGAIWFAWPHLQYLFTEHPRLGFSGIERPLTTGRVLWHYVSLLLWPDASRLQVDYNYPVSNSLVSPWTTLPALLGLVVATAIAAVAVVQGRLVWPATGWLFFMIASSVESSILMLDPIFEHRIYLPSALLLPGLVAPLFALSMTRRWWPATRVALLVAVCAAGLQTIHRNEQWGRPSQLWAADMAGGAKAARAAANASMAALAENRTDVVFDVLDRAYPGGEGKEALRPRLTAARAHLMSGKYERALRITREIQEAAPDSRRGQYLHAIALLETGHVAAARDVIRQFSARDPDELMTVQLHAYLEIVTDHPGLAIDRLGSWLETNTEATTPERMIARVQLAVATERSGDPEGAASIYRSIIRADPQNWTAWSNLAQLYRAGGSIEEARTIENYLRASGVRVRN